MSIKNMLVYHLLSLIPKGKVLTYGQINQFLGIGSSRLVGHILHQNKDPKIPCYKVVFADGSLSKNYAFGGIKKQKEFLEKDGVMFKNNQLCNGRFIDGKVDLEKSLWRPTRVLKLYFELLKKFGFPGPWPWFSQGKRATKEEIVIGSILTQNTNWRNVEKALNNLQKRRLNTLFGIYSLGKINFDDLKNLIKPAGFYNQKAERLFNFAKFIIENYNELQNFFLLPIEKAREKLLSQKGIGQETADTILLYAGEKPIFVVDNYTWLFVKSHFLYLRTKYDRIKNLNNPKNYRFLQEFFMKNLSSNVSLFQNYHALIVRWGKEVRN